MAPDTSITLPADPAGHITVESIVNGPIQTNTYFAISGDEALAIDPAWDGESLVAAFSARHPDVRIAAIACTHGHADHVGGVAGMRRALGEDVPFMISRTDLDTVAEHLKSSRGYASEGPGEPDRLLDEGDTITVGDATFTAMSTPGHTHGGLTFFANPVEGPVAFVGDTLFPGSHGRTDLFGGDDAAIMRSLAKLGSDLPRETVCLVGHGPSTTIADELSSNPYMIAALAGR